MGKSYSFKERFLGARFRNYFFNPFYWYRGVKDPKRAIQNAYTAIAHPRLYRISRSVEGLISLYTGVLLYESVLHTKSDSPNVVEVGAFKGLSTIYLSLACSRVGKRVKSFELFTGITNVDPTLDSLFHEGEFSSEGEEFEFNLKAYGNRGSVDLIIGDARDKMKPVLQDQGFAVAFLDVDTYEVTRDLLYQLGEQVVGGEIIVVHDTWSSGIRAALDEFCTNVPKLVTETEPERGTAKLVIH
jgi:hypothetical protein